MNDSELSTTERSSAIGAETAVVSGIRRSVATGKSDLREQAQLVRRLCEPGPLSPRGARLIETHISYVLLTGSHAYKVKKAVRLPFLDFRTLAARRRYCRAELELNRRFAPGLYLDVVPITSTGTGPQLEGRGPVVDYAVRMRQFPESALLSRVLARNELAPAQVDALAAKVAEFHRSADAAPGSCTYGLPERVLRLALDNLAIVAADVPTDRSAVAALESWTRAEHAARLDAFARRHAGGAIRACHGDLHLANIVLVDGAPTLFDCIEFSDEMRWIDPMSEIAFTAMDLGHRGRADLAHRFASAYFEASGDYDGCLVLRFYLVYRAMVRAKVACLRAAQLPPGARRTAAWREARALVALATRYTERSHRSFVAMHGPSGCGKSTVAQALVEGAGAIRIRTDIERKRVAGLAADARTHAPIDSGLYAAGATRQTYEHVLRCACSVIEGGFTAVADGAFLHRWQRDLARGRAAALRAGFVIVACHAAPAALRRRVAERAAEGCDPSDASVEVLAQQLRSLRPLDADELRYAVMCRTDVAAPGTSPPGAWREVIERIGTPAEPPTVSGPPPADAALAGRLQFLARPDAYAGATVVQPIETHASWVFLTDRHAYKLKKPVRTRYADLGTLDGRERNCREELRLNRRFAADVYLGVVPLRRAATGALRLEGRGETVDWLVQMRRLPAAQMLDRIIGTSRFDPRSLEAVVQLLVRVYRESGPVTLTERDYRLRLLDAIAEHERELLRAEGHLPEHLVGAICERQRAFVRDTGYLVDRVRGFHIVEGHGDLRPEHICLEGDPKIIDALEFSRELRIADAADELAFLSLECERLGASAAHRVIFATYSELTGDRPPAPLVDFYQSMRACARAMLAVRHLDDHIVDEPQRWRARALRYVGLAALHLGPTGAPRVAGHDASLVPIEPPPCGG